MPYGEVVADQKAGGGQFGTPYKFTGKELDGEIYAVVGNIGTGLYYFGARYYDPSLGIFHGVDPLAGKMPGYSPYCYTLNNPIRLIDPDGRFPITPEFRKNYPQLTNFIENRLQGYIQNSPRMSSTLLKYSIITQYGILIQLEWREEILVNMLFKKVKLCQEFLKNMEFQLIGYKKLMVLKIKIKLKLEVF